MQPEDQQLIKDYQQFLSKEKNHQTGNLSNVVDHIKNLSSKIIDLVGENQTPCYIIEQNALKKSVNQFQDAFNNEFRNFQGYYALKLNHHSLIVNEVVKLGMGLEVASSKELKQALAAGSTDILYFSPGKTTADLELALANANVVTINIDSLNELKKLGELTSIKKIKIKAGIRINISAHGSWQKYGIKLDKLKFAWNQAKKYPYLDLSGIHFHVSRNSDASNYKNTIKELATYLKNNFSTTELQEIKYIDFGGGFEVAESEGYYHHTTPKGSIQKTINANIGKNTKQLNPYYIRQALTIREYARSIRQAVKEFLDPIINTTYYSEPGRYICNNAMHIVLSIADVKDSKNIILNGGVNMVGWQRFEYEYFPVINLTNPSDTETPCNLWGNLCTTWDIWGYYCYASKFRENDILVVPNQGALTYSLAQSFIQEIPPVYLLK